MEEKHKKLEEEMQRLELAKKKAVGVIKEVRVNKQHILDNLEPAQRGLLCQHPVLKTTKCGCYTNIGDS